MDDIVKQAMAKWPNVPAVYGWLTLDRRGNWLIKNETISNPQINEFINRNYLRDERGCWFFQNGPQRVFVDLSYLPIVYTVSGGPAALAIHTHTRQRVNEVRAAWIDDSGTLVLDTDHGAGHMHDQYLEALLPCFVTQTGRAIDEESLEAAFDRYAAGETADVWFQYQAARVKIAPQCAADAPQQFGFVPQPQPE